ncbi:hypothetical protein M0R72_13870 [Candidatus Pacearchaeota archaeon]|jgi:hypothetical protein|nr:hypothetical protein [Candidatus Pacearchaeota archaeon]
MNIAESKRLRDYRRRLERNWQLMVEGSGHLAMPENKKYVGQKNLSHLADALERLERDRADAEAEEQADLRLRGVNSLETGPDADGLDRTRLAALLDSAAALTLPLSELRQIAKCKNPYPYRQKLGRYAVSPRVGIPRLRRELAKIAQKGT